MKNIFKTHRRICELLAKGKRYAFKAEENKKYVFNMVDMINKLPTEPENTLDQRIESIFIRGLKYTAEMSKNAKKVKRIKKFFDERKVKLYILGFVVKFLVNVKNFKTLIMR